MFLGIDVGTFESKGVLVERDGTVVAEARRRHGISTPAPGHVEQDPETVWWADVAAIARELTAHPVAREIDSVGISAIGPCVVATDADLNPLRPGILYGVDGRATAQIDRLTARLGTDEILRRTGNELSSQSAGPKIAWVADEEPDIWGAARWFMTSQSYLVARLTGEVTIDHATAGYFHPLYDLENGVWDTTGCEDFIEPERLPRLGWSTDLAGTVTGRAAAETGIPEGTPVIIGTTDAPAEAVGSGVVSEGDLMAMYGSSGYFIRVGDRVRFDDRLWTAPFVFEGTSVLAAGTSTAGTATRWVADLLALTDADDGVTFARLVELADRSEPGARGVLALPHFAGERTPFRDPLSRGALIGLGLEHTPSDVARAVLEGVGHSIAAALAVYADTEADAPIGRVVAIGGATRNPFIIGTVSTIIDREQEIADTAGAALGDAFLAAVGIGAVTRTDEIRGWVAVRDTVRPDPASRARLQADHIDYIALYEALSDLQHRRAQTA